MTRRIRVRTTLITALSVIVLAWGYWTVAHEFEVDACFDAGGVYIGVIKQCSHSQAELDRILLGAGAE